MHACPQRPLRALAIAITAVAMLPSAITTTAAAGEATGTPPALESAVNQVPVTEPGMPLDISWSVDIASRYSWQGFNYSDGQPVVQPGLSFGVGGFTGSIWFNHDIERGRPDEFDGSLSYGWETGPLSLAAGYTCYRYPHREGWSPTQEIGADVSADLAFSPSAALRYDVDAGRGFYGSAGVSRDLAAAPLSLTLGTTVFYHHGYYGQTGIPSVEFDLGTGFGLGGVTVSPSLSRFETWENGDFTGDGAIEPSWVWSLSVGGGH